MMALLLLAWFGLSVAVGIFATTKGHSGFGWFIIACAISPLVGGILVLAANDLKKEAETARELAVSKICPKCAERVKIAALICRYCRHEFQPSAAVRAEGNGG